MPEGVFPYDTILTHLSHNGSICKVIFCLGVMTTGWGPYDEGDFDNFLRSCGIDVYEVSGVASSKMIIGQEGWDEDKIRLAIKANEGGSFWVYSQEMVLASLAIGVDVFDVCSTDELISFGEGHPALEFLMDGIGFDWPSTFVLPSLNRLTEDSGIEWPAFGILRHLGYKVGRRGLEQTARQRILDQAYTIDLFTGIYGADCDITEWGKPCSSQRLQKIANSLASFARLKKRSRTRDYSETIMDYEMDLGYLKGKYYRSDLGFHWPDTDVFSP